MNIKTRIIIIISLLLLPLVLCAQKKELADARLNIKKGQNLEKTEQKMRELLKDSANMENEKIWLTLYDAVKKQYEQLNEKLYLKQQSDTAKLFNHTLRMFYVLESLDSIDAKVGSEHNSVPQYRKKHASYLDKYRRNIFGGGAYYVTKQKFSEALPFFTAYIDCARQPLFSSYDYANADEQRMIEAAYWAAYCGYKLHDTSVIDMYSGLAMRDPSREVYIRQYIAEAYSLKGDTARYRETLEESFAKYPANGYFFSHLTNYYSQNHLFNKMLGISSVVLSLDENNAEALMARSSALLELGQYDECIEVSDKLINTAVVMPRAYLNAGLSYYNKAIPVLRKKMPTPDDRKLLADLYRRALPYLSHYRANSPNDSENWARPLYNIYLTLNMGDEFEEIEEILAN